MHGIIIVLYS